jgi:hypothetical protein
MKRSAEKVPAPFPESRCPHGDEAPHHVIGRHQGFLKHLHDTLDVGGPKQRKMAAEIRAHIGRCNEAIAEIEAKRPGGTAVVSNVPPKSILEMFSKEQA